jgi:hypothetical protein
MSALNRILPNFARSLNKLDSLIATLELNTGTAHKNFSNDGSTSKKPSPESQLQKIVDPVANKEAPPTKNEKPKSKESAQNKQKQPQEKKPLEEEEQKNNGGGGDKAPQDLMELYTQVDIRVGRIVECWNVG